MNKVELHKIEPLLVKLDFDIGDKYYDIHNDFDCVRINSINNMFLLR